MKISEIDLNNYIGIGRMAVVYPWTDEKVIKLYRSNVAKETAEFEYKISKIMAESNVRSPMAYSVEEGQNRCGIVYDRLPGHTLLDILPKSFYKIKSVAKKFAEQHYFIHQQTIEELPEIKAQMEYAINSTSYLSESEKEKYLTQLEKLPEGGKVGHGDFHPDNVMVHNDDFYVIDWITARKGHPLMDVARTSYLLKYASPPISLFERIFIGIFRSTFHKHYLNEYFKLSSYSIEDLESFYPIIFAARFSENIETEFKTLRKLLDKYNRHQ